MNVQDITDVINKYHYLKGKMTTLARAKIFERHDAAHKAGKGSDPRYLAGYLEVKEFDEYLGEIEVTFNYYGPLSGTEIVYLKEDELKDL